ncbi:hypothetical protein [Comamonas thiooxydans]|uniref:hypothetical protein n=1 Tax=Comamonas thiooxydans TaxID=363952 RepID=UPI0011865DF6|nr:hypothetical protein [Comamonas thiooxydans]
MRNVQFSEVAKGSFFKEAMGSDAWYLKTDAHHGVCESNGARYAPVFRADETVRVEALTSAFTSK